MCVCAALQRGKRSAVEEMETEGVRLTDCKTLYLGKIDFDVSPRLLHTRNDAALLQSHANTGWKKLAVWLR